MQQTEIKEAARCGASGPLAELELGAPEPVEIHFWRQVDGYGGDYAVTDDGRVISFKSGEPRELSRTTHKVLGYELLRLSKLGERKNHYVHDLVTSAFLGERPEELVTDHINEVKTDNGVENLRYITIKENIEGNRTVIEVEDARRIKHEIERRYERGESKLKLYEEYGEKHGVEPSTVQSIALGYRKDMT